MRPTLSTWLRGKRAGVRVLLGLVRHVHNWREVWRCRKRRQAVERIALRRGPTIFGRATDDAFGLFWEIVVERNYTHRWFYRPRRGDTVVDLGANIGVFALECQRLAAGVRVLAAEPNPQTFRQLRRNVDANGLDGTVHAWPVAVGRERRPLYLKPGADTSGHQELVPEGAGEPIPCETLDDFFARAGIDGCELLKIDTEGAELDIVAGASAALWQTIRRVVIEYHDNVHPGAGAQLERRLAALGYDCRRVPTPGYPHLGHLYAVRPALGERP